MKKTFKELYVMFVAPLLLYILTMLRAKIMVFRGKGVVFHNIRYLNGEEVTIQNFMPLVTSNKTILLTSDEGNIVFNHGNPDGTLVNCDNKSFEISSRYFSEIIPDGEYWLVACYNGMRPDYHSDTHVFKRVLPTKYPLHAPIIGRDMYVCSSNESICKDLNIPLPTDEDIRKSISRLSEKE